jgi:hypothetical protein
MRLCALSCAGVTACKAFSTLFLEESRCRGGSATLQGAERHGVDHAMKDDALYPDTQSARSSREFLSSISTPCEDGQFRVFSGIL